MRAALIFTGLLSIILLNSCGDKNKNAEGKILTAKEMQSVIIKNPINSEIYKSARAKGMFVMREDAMLKGIAGVIPFREVYNFNAESE